jgi:polyisoprenoid-binding protein YceI
MNKFIVLFALLVSVLSAYSQAVYKCDKGEISFFSASPMENIDAQNVNPSSFIKVTTKDVVFVVPMRSFKFKNALMQEHFNEKYVESEKYPDATFQGKINEDVDLTKDGVYAVTAKGKLKMHGVEKEVTPTGTLTVKNNTITLVCQFDVALKDYNITIPKLVVENIADVIPVKMNIHYIPYQK